MKCILSCVYPKCILSCVYPFKFPYFLPQNPSQLHDLFPLLIIHQPKLMLSY